MVHGAIAVTETEGIEIFEARRVPQSWAVKTIPSGTRRCKFSLPSLPG
jgi:hypothetical protein